MRLDIENGESFYHYSKWSSKKWFITDPDVDVNSVKNTLKVNSVKLKWDKVPGATKYEIYMSSDAKKGYKKVASTKKRSTLCQKTVKRINLIKKFEIYQNLRRNICRWQKYKVFIR